ATGHNKEAAKYAGMNAKRNIMLTLLISGAIAGMAAGLFYLTGIEHYKIASSVPGMGFTGIAVAFLGGLNPIGTIFAGLFVEYITLGGQYLNTNYYNPQVAELMIAIIIYLCGFVLFFKTILNRPGKVKVNANAEPANTAKKEV
ncbi:MAG: ABC transporter permease, partial [Pseudobutyrivibrio sp.]|nr:ABC transporter permease [Pseudobutyrivibrio sp.]